MDTDLENFILQHTVLPKCIIFAHSIDKNSYSPKYRYLTFITYVAFFEFQCRIPNINEIMMATIGMTTPIAIWADVLRVWPPPLSVWTLVVVEDWAEEED